MSVKQKTNITVLAKFCITSTKTLDLLKAAMSCNTMGANHVTYKRVRLVQEVQELEERVHVEVDGDDDVVRLFRPQGHRSPRNCSRKVITVNQQCYKACQPALLLHFYNFWDVSSPESNASDGIVERPRAECWITTNAPAHAALSFKQFLTEKQVAVLEHPP